MENYDFAQFITTYKNLEQFTRGMRFFRNFGTNVHFMDTTQNKKIMYDIVDHIFNVQHTIANVRNQYIDQYTGQYLFNIVDQLVV